MHRPIPSASRRGLLAAAGAVLASLALLPAPLAASGADPTDAATDLDPATVLYVALPDADAIQMRDAATGALLATIALPAGSSPGQLIASPDSSRIYAAGDSWAGYIETSTNTVRSLGVDLIDSYGMTLTEDGTRVFIEDDGDPGQASDAILYEITLATMGVRAIPLLSTDDFATSAVAASPDGSTAFIIGETFNGAPQVYLAVDVATGQITSVPTQHLNGSAAVSRDGTALYLGRLASTDTTVDVHETASGQFLGSWAGAGDPPRNAASILPALDGASLYVVRSLLNGSTGVINAGVERVWGEDGTPLASWTSSQGLDAFALTQSLDGSTMYAADVTGTVTILDAYGLTVQGSWSAGATVSSIAAALVPRAPEITTPATIGLTAGTVADAAVDAVGYPAPDVAITGDLPPGITYTPDSFGRGALTGTPTLAGQWTVTVTATNVHGEARQDLVISVVPGAAARLAAVSGGGQRVSAGKQFPDQLLAQVTDANGNPVDSVVEVTFAVTPAGSAAFAGLASITVTTSADGLATSPFVTAGATPGPVTITATSRDLQDAVFALTVSEQLGGVLEPPTGSPSPSSPPASDPGGSAPTRADGVLSATGAPDLSGTALAAAGMLIAGVAMVSLRRAVRRRG
jgi:hypothetical protein